MIARCAAQFLAKRFADPELRSRCELVSSNPRYCQLVDELRRLNSYDYTDEPLGTPGEPFGRKTAKREKKARSAPTPQAQKLDAWATTLLTLAQLVFAGFLTFGAMLLGFAYDACSGQYPKCNYALAPIAFYVVPAVCALAFAFTIARILILRSRSRLTWWIPLMGAGISLASFGLSILLTMLATGRPIS